MSDSIGPHGQASSSSIGGGPASVVPGAVRKRGCLTPAFWLVLAISAFLCFAQLGPSFLRSRDSGRLTACKVNLKNIKAALDRYAGDAKGEYPTALEQLVPKYLDVLPTCHAAGTMSYRGYFGLRAPYNNAGYPDYYWVECHGQNHETMKVMGDFPAVGNHSGLVSASPYETRR